MPPRAERHTVAVAQRAERRNVDPEATGSKPVRHPDFLYPGGGTADSPGSDPGGRTALRVRIPPRVLRGTEWQVQRTAGREMCRRPIAVPCTLSPVPCCFAPVAQRTRAPDYGSGGPRFESWRRHFREIAQSAERPLWEREARGSSPRLSTGVGTGRSSARKSAGFGYQRPAVRIRASRLQDDGGLAELADCARVLTARA